MYILPRPLSHPNFHLFLQQCHYVYICIATRHFKAEPRKTQKAPFADLVSCRRKTLWLRWNHCSSDPPPPRHPICRWARSISYHYSIFVRLIGCDWKSAPVKALSDTTIRSQMGHDYSPSKMTTHPQKNERRTIKCQMWPVRALAWLDLQFSISCPALWHWLDIKVRLSCRPSLSHRFIPAANGKGQTSGFNVREKGA